MNIEKIQVKQIESMVGNGATEPLFGILEGNKRAVIKVFNNIEGNLTLVNEYICYRMATIFDLPMPTSGICLCNSNTIDLNGLIKNENLGFGFYSIYQEKNTLLKLGIMKHIGNIEIIYKLIIFDHLVYNKDRNSANLLIEYKKNNILVSVIDHSHVFKNEAIWDTNCLNTGIVENDYMDTIIMESNKCIYSLFYQTISIDLNSLLDSAHRMQELLSEKILDEIFSDIPNEWGVCENSLYSLKRYLIYRLNHLEDICSMIFHYIKQ